MKYLETQERFEELFGRRSATAALPRNGTIVYFTATWCGACRRIDSEWISQNMPDGVEFLKCDVDQNQYTAGYCGVSSIPSMIYVRPGHVSKLYSPPGTMEALKWIQTVSSESKEKTV